MREVKPGEQYRDDESGSLYTVLSVNGRRCKVVILHRDGHRYVWDSFTALVLDMEAVGMRV